MKPFMYGVITVWVLLDVYFSVELMKARTDIVILKAEMIEVQNMMREKECYD